MNPETDCVSWKREISYHQSRYILGRFSYGEKTLPGAVFSGEVFPMGEKKFCSLAVFPMGRDILYWDGFSYGKLWARIISSAEKFYAWSISPGGKFNPGLFSGVSFAELSFVLSVLPSM